MAPGHSIKKGAMCSLPPEEKKKLDRMAGLPPGTEISLSRVETADRQQQLSAYNPKTLQPSWF